MHTYTDWGTYDVELSATSTCGTDVLTDVDAITLEPDADCWIAMNETNGQATGCTGTLYDLGGPIWGYDNGLDYSVTIKPLGAGGVTLFFNYVITEGQGTFGSCYDYLTVYDGFDANSTIMGHFCDSLPAPDSLESTGSAMTVRFRSDGNNPFPSFWPGYWLEWECSPTTVAPTAEFSFENYYSCSGDIQFIDQSDGGPSSWLWNFGDGTSSTEQDPLHHYINDGTYTVSLLVSNAFGSDSITKSSTIVIGKNPAPVTIQDDICPGEVGILVPQEEGDFRWYASANDTTLLHAGDTFTTPTIQNSTLYYYENLRSPGTQQAGGALNNLMGGGGYVDFFNQALWFHAYQDIILEEVTMYTDTAGYRKITLWDPQEGVAVDSAVVFLELGENNVELNFHIPEGSYELGMWYTDLLRCFRNNSGVTYPYDIPDVLSIYNSPAGSDYYYYFYDWQVRPYCASARGEAIASVAICTGVDEVDFSEGLSVYPNPTRGELNLSQTVVPNLENIALYDAQGRMIIKLPSMRKDEVVSIDVHDLSAGVYTIKAYSDNAIATKQVIIQ
ncbi:MAG: PKD domain-containing protein [Flavobacteriales bacterium]|nr:PKD domain-containing protein [Flavobacteriales bacterium]